MIPDCIFCEIVNGAIPSEKVYEDDEVFAFLDIHPVGKGHLLVIPKTHSENMWGMPEDVYATLMRRVHMLVPHVREATNAEGINIAMNNGHAAGQLVFHTHVHIIPRTSGDGLKQWGAVTYEEGEITKVANKIRNIIKKTDQ